MYDIIIIGAGPAGLTAALYARRADKNVLVIEKETFGGQITHSPKVENYPGFTVMSGNEFADKLIEQVMFQGAEIELDTVTGIRGQEGNFTVECERAPRWSSVTLHTLTFSNTSAALYLRDRRIS